MIRQLSQWLFSVAILLVMATFGGCSSDRNLVTLSPVGPNSSGSGGGSGPAQLLVYSASYELPDRDGGMAYPHTDYKIYNERRACIQRVSNRSGAHGEFPARVDLPPGKYTVVAASEGKGTVAVPVIVESQLKTVVVLEERARSIRPSIASN